MKSKISIYRHSQDTSRQQILRGREIAIAKVIKVVEVIKKKMNGVL